MMPISELTLPPSVSISSPHLSHSQGPSPLVTIHLVMCGPPVIVTVYHTSHYLRRFQLPFLEIVVRHGFVPASWADIGPGLPYPSWLAINAPAAFLGPEVDRSGGRQHLGCRPLLIPDCLGMAI